MDSYESSNVSVDYVNYEIAEPAYSGQAAATWSGQDNASLRSIDTAFPMKSYIVANDNGVDILDASNNKLWMRLTSGDRTYINNNASTNNKPNAVTMKNGRLFVGMSGNTTGLLNEVNFTSDTGYYYAAGTGQKYQHTTSIFNRNTVGNTGTSVGDGISVLDNISSLDLKTVTVPTNLALGKISSYSTQLDGTTNAATNLDDGDRATTGWSSATSSATNQWMLFDLGSTKSVSKIVYTAGGTAANNAKDFRVQTSSDGITMNTVYSGTMPSLRAKNKVVITFPAVSTRYLRFFMDNGYSATTITANEIEVYGSTTTSADYLAMATGANINVLDLTAGTMLLNLSNYNPSVDYDVSKVVLTTGGDLYYAINRDDNQFGYINVYKQVFGGGNGLDFHTGADMVYGSQTVDASPIISALFGESSFASASKYTHLLWVRELLLLQQVKIRSM